MQSGAELIFERLLMYPAEKIHNAESWRKLAEENLGYKSLGIGFIGSLSTVVAASLAVGAVEHAITAGANRKGFEQLEAYHKEMMAIRYGGKFRELGEIENCELAAPDLWLSKEKDANGEIVASYTMLIDDPFIVLQLLDGRPLSIQWKSVEQYWIVNPNQAWL